MRALWERVMHALLFEVVLLVIFTFAMTLIFDENFSHTGMLSVGLSIIAMKCNGMYNYIFDTILFWLKRPVYPRSFSLRCLISILFELCLMIFSLPMIWMRILKQGIILKNI